MTPLHWGNEQRKHWQDGHLEVKVNQEQMKMIYKSYKMSKTEAVKRWYDFKAGTDFCLTSYRLEIHLKNVTNSVPKKRVLTVTSLSQKSNTTWQRVWTADLSPRPCPSQDGIRLKINVWWCWCRVRTPLGFPVVSRPPRTSSLWSLWKRGEWKCQNCAWGQKPHWRRKEREAAAGTPPSCFSFFKCPPCYCICTTLPAEGAGFKHAVIFKGAKHGFRTRQPRP